MDSDDLKLLNDIALIDQQLEVSTCNSRHPKSEVTFDGESQVSSAVEEVPSSQANTENPKEVNLSCQTILREMEKKLVEALEENIDKQRTLLHFLRDPNEKEESDDESEMCKLIKCAGIYYFKDYYGYPQPRNEDVKERLSLGYLLSADYLSNSCGWNKVDKECLKKAVLNEYKGKREAGCGVGPRIKEKKKAMEVDNSIDWLKISATDMNGKYSPTECEAQWKLHLCPDLNKNKWSKSETKKLNELAKKFKYQDWDKIAKALGSNRSPYQCCIEYQTKNSLNEGKWTDEEDVYLDQLVKNFKVDNQIPWTKISWYIQTRSRKQCQDRYLDHLRKDLKKGSFSVDEDKIIVSGAKIFYDFGKLSKFLPGRAPTQIRSRYYYLVSMAMSQFSDEEDKLLMSLVKKHGKDWLKISEHLPNRSKLQCRKRFSMLTKGIPECVAPEILKEILDAKKVTEQDFIKRKSAAKPRKASQCTKRKAYEKPDAFNEIVNYHANCSENYFGPRLRNPASQQQLQRLALTLRTTMAMLSISCDFSEKTQMIQSLKDNCNFDDYDIKVLNKLAEEDACATSTLKDNSLLHGTLIPPNRGTLTGCQTLLSSRESIKSRTREAEALPQISVQESGAESVERLSLTRAKLLFKSRMKSLFSLPLLLNKIPTDDLSQDFYQKKKTKKPKKMSKKRLRNHAKEMVAAHREKRRKLAEEEAATTNPLHIHASQDGQVDGNVKWKASTSAQEDSSNLDVKSEETETASQRIMYTARKGKI